MQHSLRSAVEIFKDGGSVTLSSSEKDFHMMFDNRRSITISDNSKTLDFYVSTPHVDVESCRLARLMSKIDKSKFNDSMPVESLTGSHVKDTYC